MKKLLMGFKSQKERLEPDSGPSSSSTNGCFKSQKERLERGGLAAGGPTLDRFKSQKERLELRAAWTILTALR